MFTLIVGTVTLGLFFGALWHNQPAHRQIREKADVNRGIAHFGAVFAKCFGRKARQ